MQRDAFELDDEALTRYFTGINVELEAGEFASKVLGRARRRQLIRGVVLGATVSLALLIALEPMVATLQSFARVLVAVGYEWRDPAWYRENALAVGAALAMAGWPFVTRWLAR